MNGNPCTQTVVAALFLAAVTTTALAAAEETEAQLRNRPCIRHPAPYNLTAVALESDQIHLKWRPGDRSGVGFDIERSKDGIVWEHITMGYPRGRYNDEYELEPLTTYFYRVRVSPTAKGHPCASAYSNIARCMTIAEDTAGE